MACCLAQGYGTVRSLEMTETENERPLRECLIAECGELPHDTDLASITTYPTEACASWCLMQHCPCPTACGGVSARLHCDLCMHGTASQVRGSPLEVETLCVLLQEGDPYPEWPEDAEAPEGQSEAAFRMAAAETIKSRGNKLFKAERHHAAIAKYNKVPEADARGMRLALEQHCWVRRPCTTWPQTPSRERGPAQRTSSSWAMPSFPACSTGAPASPGLHMHPLAPLQSECAAASHAFCGAQMVLRGGR